MLLKIIIGIVIFIGVLDILVIIGAGKLKTEEDRINELEEEARILSKKYHKQKNQKIRILRNNLHIL